MEGANSAILKDRNVHAGGQGRARQLGPTGSEAPHVMIHFGGFSDDRGHSMSPLQNMVFELARGMLGAIMGAELSVVPTHCSASQCSMTMPSASNV